MSRFEFFKKTYGVALVNTFLAFTLFSVLIVSFSACIYACVHYPLWGSIAFFCWMAILLSICEGHDRAEILKKRGIKYGKIKDK